MLAAASHNKQGRERPDRPQGSGGSVGKANNMLFYTAYFRIQEIGAHYQQRMRMYSKPGVKNAHDSSRLRQGFVDSAHAIVDITHACFCTSPYTADE